MPTTHQWLFGPFRLDTVTVRLWDGETPVALPPKAFDVLHYLVTHPDRLVTKEELLDAVWPATAVTDAVVRVAIGAVRKALGETAQTPRYIATVSRRGYRFLAPGTVSDSTAPGPAEPEVPAALPPPVMPPTPLLPSEAERRLLTVWCCRLVDASTLAAHLDPEAFQEVVRTFHQTCAAVIQHFDGSLVQYRVDGVLAYFGAPLAHEDDAQRAVHAGLRLLEVLATHPLPATLPDGAPLAVRLGVDTGLVVVGDGETASRQAPLALGETPQRAAHLQHRAAPNTLVISAATQHLVADYFTCVAVDALPPPTRVPSPPQGYRVLGPSGLQHRLAGAIARGLTPLVGRTAEVAILQERWARVTAGMGQVVLLVGEPGIGKSRLVHVLTEAVAHEAPLCLEARGSPYAQQMAWYPLAEGLPRWLQGTAGAVPHTPLARLEALVTQVQLPLAEAMPLLADLLALPLPAPYAPRPPLAPEQQRERTLAVLLALLLGLTAQQPVLLIVEDLHWIDPSTCELLGRLLDQVPTTRLYVVLTCRPEFQAPWGFRAHLTPLVLTRLTPAQTAAMVEAMPGAAQLPAAVRAQIVTQADGIPLFVEEVTKAVLEAGQAPHGTPGLEPGLAIPVTLHEALLARLDRVGRAKGIAQLGAVLGRQFAYALLHAVADGEAAVLQHDLATLVAAELLYQQGQPPQATYTFKHALIQEAAYASLLQRVRRELHQRIVAVLETHFPDTTTTMPALLAHHALRGERWDQAVAYFRQAGELAMARAAYREAMAAFTQALDVVPHLPAGAATDLQALDLHLALRNALWPLGELRQTRGCLQAAAALAERVQDPQRAGWVAAYLLAYYVQVCAPDQALAAGQQALTLAQDLQAVDLAVTAQHYLGYVFRSLGDYPQSVAYHRTNLARLAAVPEPTTLFRFAASVVPLYYSPATSLAECGDFAEAQRLAAEGVRLATTTENPYSRAAALWGVGFCALYQGDLQHAMAVLDEACRRARAARLSTIVPWVTAPLGAAYALVGRHSEALALLEEAIAQALAMEFLLDHARRVVWLGEAHRLAGRLDDAGRQAQRALTFARARQERGHEAYALRLLGDITARRDPAERVSAESHYRQALALADELGMRPLQAHCHRSLGRLYAATGQAAQARTELSTAIEMYRAMAMTFWLPETEATLAQVDA